VQTEVREAPSALVAQHPLEVTVDDAEVSEPIRIAYP
jgi:hypothetical protein